MNKQEPLQKKGRLKYTPAVSNLDLFLNGWMEKWMNFRKSLDPENVLTFTNKYCLHTFADQWLKSID